MKTTSGFKRGFGSPNYSRDKARAAQQAGARKLRESGKAHRWTTEEAIDAGQKGAARTAEILRQRKEDEPRAA